MDEIRQSALDRLIDVEAALSREPASDTATRAQYQCERLRHAFMHAHAEGVRFAAFTLNRWVKDPANGFNDETHRAVDALKAALEAAGHHI